MAAELNLPATVISDVKPSDLDAKLAKLSNGFPVPPLSPMGNFTHFSDGSTLPIWYNLSFFKKIPAKDGFNSFYLQQVDDLNASLKLDSFLNKPVVFFDRPETRFSIEKFEPNDVLIRCSTNTNDQVHLQQKYYNGWVVSIDNDEQLPSHELSAMSAPVSAGNHLIHFEYREGNIINFFFLSAIATLLVVGALAWSSLRRMINS